MATQTITITSDFRNGNNCKVGSKAFSHAEGFETSAIGDYSHSEGVSTKASAEGAHASGVKAVASHKYSTVWNGDSTKTVESSSEGTYVMNPVGGASGLFIGSKSFQSYIDEAASSGSEDISALKSAVQTISGEIDGAVSSTNKAQGKNYIDTEVAKKQDKLATQTAISNSLIKITTNTLGQVTGSVAVAKSDITALGIPSQDTKATVTVTGTGNAITGISATDGAITATKGSTFLTSVPSNYVKNTDALSTINSNEIAGYLKKSDSLSSVNNNEISNYVKVSVTTGNQTADNPLVDKSFVNSSIQTNTASFRGAWATFSDVPTASGDYPSDVYGNKYPTVNDYLVVLADENHADQTWRYKYTTSWETSGKSGWEAEYKVNDTAFTSEQNAAINSGVTSTFVTSVNSHVENKDNPHNVTATQVKALAAHPPGDLGEGYPWTVSNLVQFTKTYFAEYPYVNGLESTADFKDDSFTFIDSTKKSSALNPDGSAVLTKTLADGYYATQSEFSTLSGKVDTANKTLEEVV